MAEKEIKAIRIRYTGRLINGQKIIELPVPFVSKCEKTGEVVCNPVGEFDPENGQKLLDIGGQFKLEEIIYADGESFSPPDEAVEEQPKQTWKNTEHWPEARKAYEARPKQRRRRRKWTRNQHTGPKAPAIETPQVEAQIQGE